MHTYAVGCIKPNENTKKYETQEGGFRLGLLLDRVTID